jgi:hypothetical protein
VKQFVTKLDQKSEQLLSIIIYISLRFGLPPCFSIEGGTLKIFNVVSRLAKRVYFIMSFSYKRAGLDGGHGCAITARELTIKELFVARF